MLAAVSWELLLWDANSGRLIRAFKGHAAPIKSLAFSPDGSRVVSSANTVKLWDTTTGAQLRSFEARSDHVIGVLYSKGRAFSVAKERTARVWDAGSGRALVSLWPASHDGWLPMTPEGFFGGSLKASNLLTVVRGLSITTLDQIEQSLFNPDLVREALARDPNAEVRNAGELVNLEKV